jgi:hypothetical protein
VRLTEEQIEGGEIGERAAVAFLITIAGLAFALLGGSGATPDSMLNQRFGPEGADWVTRAIGILVTLAGGLWFVRCMRRLVALKQRRERSLPSFRPRDPG